ncbi:MAG: YraN family protein [Acidobacteria bacterium]|nr:YraN family protein [Acidobacteriota bacterium]
MSMGDRGWKQRFGRAGEEHAAALLSHSGFRILHRRYRRKGGEIDLIAADARHLVFIEVKARQSGRFGTAAQAVNARKQKYLIRTARHYLREFGRRGRAVRFDVITLTTDRSGRVQIEWIENAFSA